MTPAPQPWPQTALWWHVYPLGFVGADTAGAPLSSPVEHRLDRITAWLDELVALGLNGLLLGPIFASQTHGYDTVDHLRIDPRLGDEADFDALIAACRERGVRVLLDGVFNHVGREHPWWREAVEAGPDSGAAARFARGADAREVDGLPVDVFEGHDALVVLNHQHPEVVELVEVAMAHWLERGVDGWRLDAAYAVPPLFWRSTIDPLRERFPDSWFVGEVIHGDYEGYVRESGLDSVTQYELWKALRSSVQEQNLFELDWSLQRHNDFAEHFLPMTFLGNHDVTRIASAIDDERNHAIAIAMLFFFSGAPSVYAGDERGLEALKEERAGGDDAIRPEFPRDPREWPENAYSQAHRDAIAFRRQHPWLATARIRTEELANTAALFIAEGSEGERALLAVNLGDDSVLLGGRSVDGHGLERWIDGS
ncbi:alpha-amylase [Pseudoclavibacter sp. RFBJ3]|uniref:alpha-amylase family glycosyl hydrolase n=1 Tax=unclassified Pseudoclavibacter TaxID=2615177 RepID=UPI000CE722E5|nr:MULTISPECIES: alpha-amylase family glycosyl hydrolase [unclassified Pseudoclavibacter]PPF81610.1 alpha-amylase [Pseudoclavibacter sp. RFBJ5]PPF90940.1 alpha-amylase [Pseudoclavibacter sp. RFBJ3]PPG00216.1 alpha-amylase [Pseudoclavibacter sp. RFBH5]PPG20074.1 alpha-amylase [Pseudoclavibacter sp. RFBI4]